LLSYLVYMKEQRERQASVVNIEELRPVARVMTNHGLRNPAQEPVHFSPPFGNKLHLTQTFPGNKLYLTQTFPGNKLHLTQTFAGNKLHLTDVSRSLNNVFSFLYAYVFDL
jgi:hypothetical protein